MHVLVAWFTPGPMEMMIILVVAVLLFGKRLPEVGRSLGKGIVEFKKGVRGIEDEVDRASSSPAPDTAQHAQDVDDRDEATAPKFEPPTSEPKAESGESPSEPGETKDESSET